MNPPDIALVLAGVIGAGTAVVHGILLQRLMVLPFEWTFAGDERVSVTIRRLAPVLLHFSTVCWFLGGLVLIALAWGVAPGARTVLGGVVGALFLYGALGNLWGTRGRHPGWMLLTAAVGLIAVGIG